MDGLGLNQREIETVITQGMKWKEQKTEKWHARMAGVEAVFIKEENNIMVITIYHAGD